MVSLPVVDGVPLARVALAAVFLAAALAGCWSGDGGAMPAVPELAAESFPEPVRPKARSLIDGVAASPTDPWANGDLAMLLHAHERLSAAQDLYRRAATLSGGEFRWTYLLGIAQHQGGQHAQAASSLRTALDIRPYGPAWIRLGEVLSAGGRLEAARDALRAASNMDGNAGYVSYALGKVLLELGETAEALALLERALALAPDFGAVRRSLGMAYRSAGE